MLPDECLFCANLLDECRCENVELKTKETFLKLIIDAINEFAPRTASKLTLFDTVDFVNDWFESHFDLGDD